MPVAPAYLCVSFKRPGQSSRANRYTGGDGKEDWWMVGFISANIPGIGFRMGFESEAQARHFSLWQLFRPGEVMDGMGPDVGWIAGEPYQVWDSGITNPYIGTPQRVEMWVVPFRGSGGGVDYLEVRHPNKRDASKYARGKAYKKRDIFGTLASAANDNPPMQYAVTQARQRQKDAEEAEEDAREAEIEAARQAEIALEADYAAKIQAEKDAAAAAAKAKAAAAAAAAAAAKAKAAAAAAAAIKTPPTGSAFPAQQNWTITQGGASGWYASQTEINLKRLIWVWAGTADARHVPFLNAVRSLTSGTYFGNFQWYGVYVATDKMSSRPIAATYGIIGNDGFFHEV